MILTEFPHTRLPGVFISTSRDQELSHILWGVHKLKSGRIVDMMSQSANYSPVSPAVSVAEVPGEVEAGAELDDGLWLPGLVN